MLTVITFNVMFNDILLRERHRALIALLMKNAPDVICLQEVRKDLVPWFIESLSEQYQPVIFDLQPVHRKYGELLFTKHNIEALLFECIPLPSKMERALQYVKIRKDTEIWNVITLHLESLNCSRVRQQQLKIIWENYSDLSHTIFCGDTNMKESEKCDLPENIADAWDKTTKEIGKYTYYSNRYWDGNRKQRYDRIWLTNDIELDSFGLLGDKPLRGLRNKWISDHDGLYVSLEFTKDTFGRTLAKSKNID
jgi:endonuclease/exonuclease/phosphatase family metal-dependent hydrolase